MSMLSLKYYKHNPKAKDPIFATRGSACFDLHACFDDVKTYKVRQDTLTREIEKPLRNGVLQIYTMERVLVPTGLVLDIPAGYSVRIHPRSGTAIKQGMSFINCEGVIDFDYIDPLMIPVINLSDIQSIVINNNDRIAQGELVRLQQYNIEEISAPPKQKTSRTGGFGSTGA